jgi:hypothetical protein
MKSLNRALTPGGIHQTPKVPDYTKGPSFATGAKFRERRAGRRHNLR